MADLRISSAAAASLQAPQPLARVDAARAASRAFFQSATQTPLPAAPAVQPAAPLPVQAQPDPQRPLRPGSLIDIKV